MNTPSLTSSDARPGRIILLDDEAEIRNMLRRYLSTQGFDVRAVEDSVQLERCLEREPYDLLLLDIMLGEPEDGLAICRRLRARGQTMPILMLTARGDPIDKVVGLEMGADDYLAKPFNPSELVARVRAMLRRQQYQVVQQGLRGHLLEAGGGGMVRFGPFVLDLGRQELSSEGVSVVIGHAEMRLLCALAATPNRPVSRANLIERARGRDHDALARSVDVQVLRLRQVIELDAGAPKHIRTVWGLGYMLVAEYSS